VSEFIWPVRVYYEDTDSGGVVYYANYLKFMERARTEWLRSLGYEQDMLLQHEGIIFAVHSLQVDYHQAACFNDLLRVTARLDNPGKASMTFIQKVLRDSDNALLCSGRVKIACLDAGTFRPRAIPGKILTEIRGDH